MAEEALMKDEWAILSRSKNVDGTTDCQTLGRKSKIHGHLSLLISIETQLLDEMCEFFLRGITDCHSANTISNNQMYTETKQSSSSSYNNNNNNARYVKSQPKQHQLIISECNGYQLLDFVRNDNNFCLTISVELVASGLKSWHTDKNRGTWT